MNDHPFFSILIPVYNREDQLDVSLESIHKQTFSDYEIIYVDDGSTDGSYQELQKISGGDDRIRVFQHEKNSSLLASRFTGMKEAKGEYLLFLDSDDYYTPDTLETLHREAELHPADVLIFGVNSTVSGREAHPLITEDPLKDLLQGRIAPGVVMKSPKRSVAERIMNTAEPFYCNMGEDSFMSTVIFANAKSYHALDRLFYQYVDEGGMSATSGKHSVEMMKKALDSLRASGEHITGYISKYRPDYLEYAQEASRRLLRYAALQYTLYEKDYRDVYEALDLLRKEGCRDAFDFGCNRVLEAKVKRSLGMEATFNFDLK